ncbi:MAG TPA: hypothetical protein DIC34_05330 [Treponema sp.]|nr:MAG: hypothetical protein A2Y36_12895 [Treponema sp. GWA1_62_8]OHE67765.1 MAG: hypothetical protein A2001_14560 [Treponema sp. GWC1_61_84]HCM25960.1 hypothetical protein [Treponema sp.]
MDSALVLYSSGLIAAVLVSLTLACFAFFRSDVPGAAAFLFGNLAAAVYALGSMFEIVSPTLERVMSSLTLEYFGIATVGPLWMLTLWCAVGGVRRISPGSLAALFLVPGLIILLVATNQYHHLFYSSVSIRFRGPFTVPVLGKGPFYMVNLVYMNLCLFLGTLSALRQGLKSPPALRKPFLFLFFAALVPWGGMFVYQSGLSPWGLDTAPFGLSLSGILLSLALFRFKLFDLTPLVADQVFEDMREGVLVLDAKDRVAGFNPAMLRICPDLSIHLIGQSVHELEARFPDFSPLWRLDGDPPEDLVIERDGIRTVYQVEKSALRERRRGAQGRILMFADITQRVELSRQLALMAGTDELTGLANRRYFLERFRQEAERQRRYGGKLSVVMVDLDRFKAVNDVFGHEAGDAVLRLAAKVWLGCLRDCDLLARYGGEEFIFLLPETTVPDARILSERLRSSLEAQTLEWNGRALRATASFGLAGVESPVEADIDDLLSRADHAMYKAKEAGRNRVELG